MTTNQANSSTITALRTWKGSKAVITIYLDGAELASLGGARAARAEAAIVADWSNWYPNNRWSVEIRGDLKAAEMEAYRKATATTKGRGRAERPIRNPAMAVAVPVTEG